MRRSITYANVTATLALVFSMSGGALAARHYLINSTKQINPKVLKKLRGRTGPAGPPGKEGAKGKEGQQGEGGARGPSDVYEEELESESAEVAGNTKLTLTLPNLPAGSYAISAKASLVPTQAIESGAECALAAGSDRDISAEIPSSQNAFFFTIDTSLAHTFTETGNVTLTCRVDQDKWLMGAGEIGSTRIVAVRVDSLHRVSTSTVT